MLLQDHQLDKDVKKAIALTFYINMANKAINKRIDKAIDEAIDEAIDKSVNETVDENEEIINIKKFSDKFSGTNNPFSTLSQQIIFVPIRDKEDEIDKTEKSLEELFKKAYEDNDVIKKIMDTKARDFRKLLTALTKKDIILSMGDLKIESKWLYMKNRMYILENKPLQLFLLQ